MELEHGHKRASITESLKTIHVLVALVSAITVFGIYVGREWLTRTEAERTYLRQDLYNKDRESLEKTLIEIKLSGQRVEAKLDRWIEKETQK